MARFSVSIAIVLVTLALCGAVRNSNVERTIDLTSQVAQISVDITVEEPEDTYVFLLPKNAATRLASVRAVDKTSGDELEVQIAPTPAKAPEGSIAYGVASRRAESLEITYQLFEAQQPFPAEIAQDSPHLVKFTDSVYVLSPYETLSQTTNVVVPSGGIESKTEVAEMSERDDGVEYGPFEGVEPFQLGEELNIHFQTGSPFFTVTSLVKDVEVSFWGSVSIVEDYALKHAGAKLGHGFDRLEFQRRSMSGDAAPSAIRFFNMPLPKSVENVYYRDTIGNISTSRFSVRDDNALLQFFPRFPLFGGWKTEFTVGYNLPTAETLFVSAQDRSRYSFRLPVSTSIEGAVTKEAVVRLVLPEGATDIQVKNPGFFDRVEREIRYTYVDTVGRPVVVITKNNVVDDNNRDIEVEFTFGAVAMYQEPFQLVLLFFLLFVAGMVYVRFELRIEGKQEREQRQWNEKKAAKVAAYSSELKALIDATHEAVENDSLAGAVVGNLKRSVDELRAHAHAMFDEPSIKTKEHINATMDRMQLLINNGSKVIVARKSKNEKIVSKALVDYERTKNDALQALKAV